MTAPIIKSVNFELSKLQTISALRMSGIYQMRVADAINVRLYASRLGKEIVKFRHIANRYPKSRLPAELKSYAAGLQRKARYFSKLDDAPALPSREQVYVDVAAAIDKVLEA